MAVKKFSTDSSIQNSFKLSRGATSVAKPEAPTIGAATQTGSTTATVAYTAATLGATGTTFTATSTPSSLTGTGASPITVSGLTALTNYTFTVKASNANGDSPLSSASNQITTAAVPTAYESIATVTVGSGGAADITFSSITSTYKHLQIRGMAYGSNSGNLYGRFNGDTTSNYARHFMYGDGTSAVAGADPSVNYFNIGLMSNTGNNFAPAVVDILDYTSVTKNKTIKSMTAYDLNGSGLLVFYSGAYFINNTAISSIRIFPQTGTFSQYTQFALYGIKGA